MLCPDRAALEPVLDQARSEGIEHMLCVSVSLERFAPMMALIEPYRQVSASVGVHPDGVDVEEPDVQRLVQLADDPRIVAIGETGLDYFRSEGDVAWQRERFRRHIRAAREIGKPLIVHTRAAREDTLRIMAEERAAEAGGVLHCFTEDWDMAQAAMDMNFYISFSGIVTFKNAQALKDVARAMPSARMLVETDSPYLAPVPRRGKTNQPAYVKYVTQYIADLRDTSLEALAQVTRDNFYALFKGANRESA